MGDKVHFTDKWHNCLNYYIRHTGGWDLHTQKLSKYFLGALYIQYTRMSIYEPDVA